MEIITIGTTVMKAKNAEGKTIARAHAMSNGLWAVSYQNQYEEMEEEEAKRVFRAKVIAFLLGE